ncbi:hypothetical protein CASFOL_042114 [Castilleja foliolosa]|uniref:Uncharacterized protein n=1 Tax=Castilleja foliolosa TaxID=1961234 RepID=A0ABD3B9K7_9LAMI
MPGKIPEGSQLDFTIENTDNGLTNRFKAIGCTKHQSNKFSKSLMQSGADHILILIIYDDGMESDSEECSKLKKGKEKVNPEETVEMINEQAIAIVNVKDMKEKNVNGCDATYKSRNKKMRIKQEK